MQQMSETRQNVQDHLEARWPKGVRPNPQGFKVNVEELDNEDIHHIECIPAVVKYKIKRSGTGLVIIIIT